MFKNITSITSNCMPRQCYFKSAKKLSSSDTDVRLTTLTLHTSVVVKEYMYIQWVPTMKSYELVNIPDFLLLYTRASEVWSGIPNLQMTRVVWGSREVHGSTYQQTPLPQTLRVAQ